MCHVRCLRACCCGLARSYVVELSSDDAEFGGHARVDKATQYFTEEKPHAGRPCSMQVYSPQRTVLVFSREPDA